MSFNLDRNVQRHEFIDDVWRMLQTNQIPQLLLWLDERFQEMETETETAEPNVIHELEDNINEMMTAGFTTPEIRAAVDEAFKLSTTNAELLGQLLAQTIQFVDKLVPIGSEYRLASLNAKGGLREWLTMQTLKLRAEGWQPLEILTLLQTTLEELDVEIPSLIADRLNIPLDAENNLDQADSATPPA